MSSAFIDKPKGFFTKQNNYAKHLINMGPIQTEHMGIS